MKVITIDLEFLGYKKAIASYLIESQDGLILVDTGPYTCFEILRRKLKDIGKNIEDIKHVLLTHIHLDHSGAAWALAELGANIYVHPIGNPHLIDPKRLINSAKKIYKNEMEKLWGKIGSIPIAQVYTVAHEEVLSIGEHDITVWFTPGHANHHVSWQIQDIMFTGDVAGIQVDDSPIIPPCPPPDIDLEKWQQSILLIQSLGLSKLYLTHFGELKNPIYEHLDFLSDKLFEQSEWIRQKLLAGLKLPELHTEFKNYIFKSYKKDGVSDKDIQRFEVMNPVSSNVLGFVRYWNKLDDI